MSRARDISVGTFSGTLEAPNFSDGTTSVVSTYLTGGSAKAWVNFNGAGTVSVRDSFNLSSLTDLGVGLNSLSFTSSMANASYCVSGHAIVTAGYPSDVGCYHYSRGVGTFDFNLSPKASATWADAASADAIVHGDLA